MDEKQLEKFKTRNKWRGKNLKGEWKYGIPIFTHIGVFIIFEKNPHYCEQYNYMEINELEKIDENTLSQYIELQDINGNEIYEGDIVECNENLYLIKFQNFSFKYVEIGNEINCVSCIKGSFQSKKIVGNIFE